MTFESYLTQILHDCLLCYIIYYDYNVTHNIHVFLLTQNKFTSYPDLFLVNYFKPTYASNSALVKCLRFVVSGSVKFCVLFFILHYFSTSALVQS